MSATDAISPVVPTSTTDAVVSKVTDTAANLTSSNASQGQAQTSADQSLISGASAQSAATYSRNRASNDQNQSAMEANKAKKADAYNTALRTVNNLNKMTKAYSETATRTARESRSQTDGTANAAGSFASLFQAGKQQTQLGLDPISLSSAANLRNQATSEGQLPLANAVAANTTIQPPAQSSTASSGRESQLRVKASSKI